MLFSEVHCERTKGNRHKLLKGKLQLFQLEGGQGGKPRVKVVKDWSMLLREGLPSLALCKMQLKRGPDPTSKVVTP